MCFKNLLWQNARMSIEVPSPSSLRRVLVTKLRHHGDVLLASPVISMPQAPGAAMRSGCAGLCRYGADARRSSRAGATAPD
jgi:hypothetical protein